MCKKIEKDKVECYKCKKQTTELLARWPENCSNLCACGREYTIKPIWNNGNYICKPQIVGIWLCEVCALDLEILEDEAMKVTLYKFLGEVDVL